MLHNRFVDNRYHWFWPVTRKRSKSGTFSSRHDDSFHSIHPFINFLLNFKKHTDFLTVIFLDYNLVFIFKAFVKAASLIRFNFNQLCYFLFSTLKS